MTQSVLSVRMDSDTKAAFSRFCEEIGMSVSTAINVFARQTIREQRLPFEITANVPGMTNESPQDTDAHGVLTLNAIRDAVQKAASEVTPIKKVILFGSYARGEARPDSDIDLRIIYDGNLGMIALGGFAEAVRAATSKEVDVISKQNLGDSSIAKSIKRDGITIYER